MNHSKSFAQARSRVSLQARVFVASGSVATAGPDRAGAPHANVVTFEPPVVTIGGQTPMSGRHWLAA